MSDMVGQALSVLCIVHCAVTPFLVLAAPALTPILGDAHPVLLVLVLATAVWAFVPSYRHHHNIAIPAMGLAGVGLLALGALVFHAQPWVETGFTVMGAVLMLVAHWRNRVAHRQCHSCAVSA